jgi:hypothetical protein
MPALRELLDAALGRVEPSFDIDDLRHRAARRRRQRFVTQTIIAVLVPSLVLGGILALSSNSNERRVTTAASARRVFSASTNTVLAFSDGLDGLLLVDLDHNRAVRRPLGGAVDAERSVQPARVGDSFVVYGSDGVMYAVPIDGGPRHALGPATLAIPAVDRTAVWLVSGEAAGETPTYRLVDGAGRVLQQPPANAPELASKVVIPSTGVAGGLAFESPTSGVRVWNTTTGTVRVLGDGIGAVGAAHGSLMTWCDRGCTQFHITDLSGPDRVFQLPRGTRSFDARSSRFSPDGTHLAVATEPASVGAVVVYDIGRGTSTVFTGNRSNFATYLGWSPDGAQLFFSTYSWMQRKTAIGRFDLASGVVERATLPFGSTLSFLALDRGEASTFLHATTGPPAACPAPDAYPSDRTAACAFRFTPRRRAPRGRHLVPCPVTTTVRLGSRTGRAYGRTNAAGTLSILVPRDGSYAAPRDPKGGYDLKIPFYRDNPGHLSVSAKRLDGPGSATIDMHESGYPPTGFLPTGPIVSGLGCWRIVGRQGDRQVSAVIRITDAGNGPAG